MKYTEEQKELIALLPQNAKDYKLTDSAKLVWGHLIFMYGTDFAKDNGFVYRTNLALMEDTGIKSEMTILKSIRQLEEKGIISTKRGKRGEASEYILLDEKYSNEEKNIVINYSNKSENYSNKIEDMELTINDLMKRIEQLEQEIIVMKKYSNEGKKYSTDTESDSDTKKESGYPVNSTEVKRENDQDHEWNDDDLAEAYGEALANGDLRLYGLNVKGNGLMECQDQEDNFNNDSKIKPNGNANTPSNADKNKWITWYFDEMNSILNSFAETKTKEGINAYQQRINELFQKSLNHEEWFTEKQWKVNEGFADRYTKLLEIKTKYLNRKSGQTESNENTTFIQDNTKREGDCAADIYTDDEWAMKVEEAFNNDQPNPTEATQKPQERHSDDEWNDYVIARFKAAEKAENEAKKTAPNEWQFDINTIPF